jgi:hypothetical protein
MTYPPPYQEISQNECRTVNDDKYIPIIIIESAVFIDAEL